jgi:hypothetical protein
MSAVPEPVPITGAEMVKHLTATCRCGHGRNRHVLTKVEQQEFCAECGQHNFQVKDCPCPHEWKGYGRLYGVSMGKGWVRMADAPECEAHCA